MKERTEEVVENKETSFWPAASGDIGRSRIQDIQDSGLFRISDSAKFRYRAAATAQQGGTPGPSISKTRGTNRGSCL